MEVLVCANTILLAAYYGLCKLGINDVMYIRNDNGFNFLIVYFVSLSCFRNEKSCLIFYIVQFLLFADFAPL